MDNEKNNENFNCNDKIEQTQSESEEVTSFENQDVTSSDQEQEKIDKSIDSAQALSKSISQAIAPFSTVAESIGRITQDFPMQAFMAAATHQRAAVADMTKQLFETLMKYDNFTLSVAQSIGNLASTISKIHETIFASPIWSEIGKIGQQLHNDLEKRHLYKSAVIERWNALEHDLKTQNRYFPNKDFLSTFDDCTKEASYTFNKGRTLYRARLIHEELLPSDVKDALNFVRHSIGYPAQHSLIWDYLSEMQQEIWEDKYVHPFNLQNVDFWGFDMKGSGAPPSEDVQKHGRANPPGISYLYAATRCKTAIAEIQPINGELISVAKIKTKKRLKLFSFDFHESLKNSIAMRAPIKDFEEIVGVSYWELEIFFDTISELFSRPALRNDDNYYVTQFLSEYIKSKGFDGIKFKSSLKKNGTNVVLFDTSKDDAGYPKNYDIVESHLHYVRNVSVTSSKVLPKL